MKRILLFLATNIAVMLALSVAWSVLSAFVPALRGTGLLPLLLMCLFWGMAGSFISLQMSRWMAKWSMGIKLLNGATGDATLDWVHETTVRLARQAGLPEPEVGYYESEEVNAFATGPSKSRSLVAVSTGIMRTMNRQELEGVLAHEVSHIGNGDMVTMTLIQGVVNAFVMFFARIIAWGLRSSMRDEDGRESPIAGIVEFATIIILQIVFGILGSMITAWFSRKREYRADAGAAALSGREKMIAALRKLQTYHDAVDTSEKSFATLKIAGKQGWMAFFSTHPDLSDRIAALEENRR
ncbi:MAG: Zn-dependent protease [Fibrobacterota bacterium]|jgi:heat shock protein HtpX